MKKILIAPSILSADFANLAKDVAVVESAGADWLHVDVMDGHFVPNITIGPVVVKSIKKYSKLFFDVHLMITNPEKYWESFYKAGADLIVFHNEVSCDKKQLIQEIKKTGIKVGVSIKPKTPVNDILEILPLVDVVLIMTVEPGFGGQSFMADMVPKISSLRKIIDDNKYKCLIEIDGGINDKTAKVCIDAGADVLVSGSYIFAAQNPQQVLKGLKSL
ncbi:ribulose-phosphate 3-epimerase [Candidatus Ruminimicrobiellum ovillum]|uniref:ribulose-phosphate 3-epimerase n=1 Tax=Candidatus Ruminimicrobiellum ovillum TaxID=1947927 RepID=UPI003559B8A7